MLCVVFPNIFYSEVVDDKTERDGSSAVAEEAGSVSRGR